jgi:exodeoxyribonuclease-3
MPLKVLSYNIREGGRFRLRALARVIRAQQPDAVALLEANSRVGAQLLARQLGMRLTFGRANNAFHVAWLSHRELPLTRSANHRLPTLAKTLLEIEVLWDGAPLRLFATHLAAGRDVLHPAQEAPAILELLRPPADQPHLLVGDFNALHPADTVGPPPWGEEKMHDAIDGDPRQAIRCILTAGYTDCYRTLHPDTPGYSYPAETPWLRLDYIFANPPLAARLSACDVVNDAEAARASDHFPVWAEFR